jgi:hypothetical protein
VSVAHKRAAAVSAPAFALAAITYHHAIVRLVGSNTATICKLGFPKYAPHGGMLSTSSCLT